MLAQPAMVMGDIAAKVVADDPGRLLIGTVDRLNGASRITAERAGRQAILEAVFVSLGP
jgi:hypothetical protein